jgi:hypothetical protein
MQKGVPNERFARLNRLCLPAKASAKAEYAAEGAEAT